MPKGRLELEVIQSRKKRITLSEDPCLYGSPPPPQCRLYVCLGQFELKHKAKVILA